MIELKDFSDIKTLDQFCETKCAEYIYLSDIENSSLVASKVGPFGEWIDILKNQYVRRCLLSIQRQCLDQNCVKIEKFQDLNCLFLAAISSLQLYVMQNFICPIDRSIVVSLDDLIHFIDDYFNCQNEALKIEPIQLETNGTDLIASARDPELLRLSRFVFKHIIHNEYEEFKKNPVEFLHLLLWRVRSAIIHQISLCSPVGSLYQEILTNVKEIESYLEKSDDLKIDNYLKMNFYIEMANIFIWFGDQSNSKKYFFMAQKCSDIIFDLIGCLGVRTQFQTKSVSQLKVILKRNSEINADDMECEKKTTISVPNNVKSEDQTLLQEVKFVSNQQNAESEVKLRPMEQALMITFIKFSRRFGSSSDSLLKEQLLTYIYFLLQHSDNWIMQFNLLEMRSLFEQTNRRLVERSMKQLQTLIETVTNPEGTFDNQATQRMFHFYSVLSSPIWKIEKNHADLLCSLGLYKSALDYYVNLKQWKDVIECYRRMGSLEKAEKIVREKLSENDDQPDMHCLLGEITGDIKCFEYSWEISNQRYWPAQKMLGLHYFKIEDYDKASECFWKVVLINSIQIDAWFRLGYIGLLKEDWNSAAIAYRKVLEFDSDSFEAWNNLSKAYIKLGDKERAMKTLQESIKLNFENWKIWENYIAVCADLGEVQEVIQAWHRLIDIKGKYLDDHIADILVKCVQDDQQRLINKTLELFARITSTSAGTAKTWQLYGRLLIMANRNENDLSKIDQCLQKSQRQMFTTGWEKNVDEIMNILEHVHSLSEDIFKLAEKQNSTESSRALLNTFKSSVNSILTLVNKNKQDLLITEDQTKRFESNLETTQQIFDEILNKLNQLK